MLTWMVISSSWSPSTCWQIHLIFSAGGCLVKCNPWRVTKLKGARVSWSIGIICSGHREKECQCICLLCNRLPPNWVAWINKQLPTHTISMGQGYESNLIGHCRFKILDEVAVKMSAGIVITWRFGSLEDSFPRKLTCIVSKLMLAISMRLSSSLPGPFHRAT